eukprot:CAMPEP_0113544614 /NCGR_PEP_ID=MMETSP0015_2-20120614/10805_1 /TAXON_ID=2838 /ORGANISM="Odontella" /LENGTH=641 /DNA_ID=CAMNT_0000444891 /DNA_START=274 /DNA_END=2199 /DNA_ORIENTATION=+ /assembly_acc=CAM_ASM_000160
MKFGIAAVWAALVSAAPFADAFVPLVSQNAAVTASRSGDTLSASSMEKATEVVTSAPDMKAYSSGYKTLYDEQPCEVHSPSIGSLPADLKGTYFRCGPAMFSAGSLPPPPTSLVKPKFPPVPDGKTPSRMVSHPFEGDGAVLAITLPGDGKATSRCRYIRTNAFTNERKRGDKMYDGMEPTRASGPTLGGGLANDFPLPAYRHHLQPGLNRKRKNTSNTRAIYWSKKLLTMWEGGLPYKLDALALSTEGRSQLGGVLKEADPFGAGIAYDPSKERVLLYSNRQDSGRSELRVYEFNSKFRLVPEGGGIVETELPGFAMIGDLAATENYAVVVQPEVNVNGMQFLMSKEPGKSIDLNAVGGTALLHLIPRVGSQKQKKTLPIPADGLSHADVQFCNAYESDNGKTIVIDAIRSDPSGVSGKTLPWPWATTPQEYARTASRKSLWRYSVDVAGGSVTSERVGDIQAQYGVINPEYSGQEHQYVYAAVGGSIDEDAIPPRGIAKFDVRIGGRPDVWVPEAHEFCGEPMYAPRAGLEDPKEDSGYIVSVLYDGKIDESFLVVLSASDVAKGPVARVPLGMALPHGLHGCFASSEEAVWDAEEIRRRAKLADKMEGRGSMWNEVKSDFSGLGLRLDDLEEYFGDVI